MASYTVPAATTAWQTAPAPSANAWLQPIGGAIYVSTDASPSINTAGIVTDLIGYPVTSGVAIKYRAVGEPGPSGIAVRLWDK